MKTKTYLILAATLLLSFLLVIQQACKKEEPQNTLPTCKITSPANGQEITKGETVTISVETNDSDGNIVEVRFFINGGGKGSATSFPYNYSWNTNDENIGTHTIKATSFDNNGGSTSDEINVAIIGSPPVANFTVNITSGTAPLTVNFTDQSTNNPTNWNWNFGDGGTSTQQNPTHVYNNEGIYTVTLTVTNDYGSDVKTRTDYIVVSGGSTGTFTDPRDGQTYHTVEIGSQEWFAENLNYETSNSWWYGNSSINGNVYGRLYTWYAALTACPSGWNLPSDEEWKTLEMYLGMSQSEADTGGFRGTDEGEKLKSTSGWYSGGNGTDTVGFTALPGGYRDTNGTFTTLGDGGYWWSATANGSTYAWYRRLFYNSARVGRYYDGKEGGFSVRCLRD